MPEILIAHSSGDDSEMPDDQGPVADFTPPFERCSSWEKVIGGVAAGGGFLIGRKRYQTDQQRYDAGNNYVQQVQGQIDYNHRLLARTAATASDAARFKTDKVLLQAEFTAATKVMAPRPDIVGQGMDLLGFPVAVGVTLAALTNLVRRGVHHRKQRKITAFAEKGLLEINKLLETAGNDPPKA